MDQPAEETAAALEDLCDDLHALKKLYGLIQRENTNEVCMWKILFFLLIIER